MYHELMSNRRKQLITISCDLTTFLYIGAIITSMLLDKASLELKPCLFLRCITAIDLFTQSEIQTTSTDQYKFIVSLGHEREQFL